MAISWLINGGDPNHLRTGMILQVGTMNHHGALRPAQAAFHMAGFEVPQILTIDVTGRYL